MKTLHLVLTAKWYDMIDRGEKKEEYREVKQYWMKRLIEDVGEDEEGDTCCHVFYVDYDRVCFHRGYTSTTMTFAVKSIDTGRGKTEWGAPEDRDVFIIKLGGKIMTEKPILDACCGGRMFYFDKHDDRVLFQDIRKVKTTLCDGRPFEVSPDVQADFTNMPYPDGSFSMVVFDPPHLKYTGSQKESKGYQMIKYGSLPKDWRDILSKGFAECFRVLKQGGFLIFKWNETDIKVSEVLKLTPEKPVFGHISGKRSNTHWICFMKK